jgi:hypothetical protein
VKFDEKIREFAEENLSSNVVITPTKQAAFM